MSKLFTYTIHVVVILLLATIAHARDPDTSDPIYYGEAETVGGSEWTAGDTFLAIALPLAIAGLIVLPHIFDGECQDWPVHKFALPNMGKNLPNLGSFKFPTRRP